MKERLIRDISLIVCDYFTNNSIGNPVDDFNNVYEIVHNSTQFLFDIIEDREDC